MKILLLILLTVLFPRFAFAVSDCDNYQTLHPEWDFCTDFETGWPPDWDPSSDLSRTFVSTTMPFQGTQSLEWVYLNNVDSSGFTYKFLSQNYTELYLRWYLRLSSNWVGTGCAGGQCNTKGPIVNGSGFSLGSAVYHMQDSQNVNSPNYGIKTTKETNWDDTLIFQNVGTPVTWQNDRWYCVESHVKLNTPGQANGLAEMWIDDNQVINSPNHEFIGSSLSDPSPSNYHWNFLFWSGSKYPSSAGTQYRWYDNIIASSQRIGCFGTGPSTLNAPTNLQVTIP